MKLFSIVFLVLATTILSVESKGRITFGNNAESTYFKYQVTLITEGGALCGGSIIDKQWVLTAAHCFKIGNQTTVLLGYVGTNMFMKTVYSNKVFIHEQYFRTNISVVNDIALLRIAPIEFNNYIRPVMLPYQGQDVDGGENVTVSGFGVTESGLPSRTLKTAVVTVLSNQECLQILRVGLYTSQFCTMHPISNVCSGDSGGPIVIGQGENAIQVGLVSHRREKYCTTFAPAIQTRITSFMGWIKKTMDDNRI